MNLKLLNNIYINNKENLVHNFNKCGYEYRIYIQDDIITRYNYYWKRRN